MKRYTASLILTALFGVVCWFGYKPTAHSQAGTGPNGTRMYDFRNAAIITDQETQVSGTITRTGTVVDTSTITGSRADSTTNTGNPTLSGTVTLSGVVTLSAATAQTGVTTLGTTGAIVFSGTAHPAGSIVFSGTDIKFYVTGSTGYSMHSGTNTPF